MIIHSVFKRQSFVIAVIFLAVLLPAVLSGCGTQTNSEKDADITPPVTQEVLVDPSEELYLKGTALLQEGDILAAKACFMKCYDYKDSFDILMSMNNRSVSGNGTEILLLNNDGTVSVAGQNNTYYYAFPSMFESWNDIVEIDTVFDYTAGLKSDGTVVIGGLGKPEEQQWTDIVDISVGYHHIAALKSDGTVVAAYLDDQFEYIGQCDVQDWTDIVAISANKTHTVGLKSDGTVVSTKLTPYTDNEDYGQTYIEHWTDIVSVATSRYLTVGLKSDGTIVTTGDELYNETESWTDIVAIETDYSGCIFGIKEDGTVVFSKTTAARCFDCDVSDWHDIVSIHCDGFSRAVGLMSDGTLVCSNENIDLSSYTDVRVPEITLIKK